MLFLEVLVLVACLAASGAVGQEVRLRKGDTLKLEVPQRVDLGRLLIVDDRGQVVLPIVGGVNVEGLTLAEANGAVLRSLQDVYPSVQSIDLALIGEEARRYLYVQGQVAQPGKYELEGSPNAWDAIKEAGGATGAASLESVRIIRVEGERSTTTVVNVRQALDSGDLQSLPPLKPGDTIIVPEKSAAYESAGTGAVNVIGAVVRPSSYFIGADKRLVDAILAAGGTSENANLGKVRIIRRLSDGGVLTMKIDFKRYLETGDLRHNPVILPNDTVSVPRSSALRSFIVDPRILLGFITAVATTVTIIVSTR